MSARQCDACARGPASGLFDLTCTECAARLMQRAPKGVPRIALAAHIAATATSTAVANRASEWLARYGFAIQRSTSIG